MDKIMLDVSERLGHFGETDLNTLLLKMFLLSISSVNQA
jgi:hypothetical protein